jgi:DNA primase
MNISVEDALKEFGIRPIREPEKFRVKCPFHDDTNPSGTIHHKTGFFQCWSCGKKTSLAIYLTKYSNLPIFQVKVKLGVRSDCKNPVAFQDVENWHIAIWEHPTFLHELHQRCITDELIRKYRLGVINEGTEKRITIPILNEIGEYVNVRKYVPGAVTHKFTQLHGRDRSRTRLYPIEQLEYDQILICGGELKAVAAAAALNP